MFVDALEGSLRRLAGITRVADITGLDYVGIPVVAAIRPAARSLSIASGKGPDREVALASGLFEAFEQYCAEYANVPVIEAPRDQHLTDARFLDPAGLALDRRARIDSGRDVRWTRAISLARGTEVYVPLDLVHLNLTVEGLARSDGFLTSTNGLAAGTDRCQAILHALCEVIERDALAVAGRPRGEIALQLLPRIDLGSVNDSECRSLIERCKTARIAVEAWDATSDIEVPVVYCRVSERPEAAYSLAPPTDGSGCSPQPSVALCRAITEALQSRLTLISGARDDILRRYYRPKRPCPPARPPARQGSRRVQDLPSCPGSEPSRCLAWVLSRLSARGFADACCVDLARPELDAAAVRVIVPGLEGMKLSRGYLPGARAHAAWHPAYPGRR